MFNYHHLSHPLHHSITIFTHSLVGFPVPMAAIAVALNRNKFWNIRSFIKSTLI